MPQILSGKPILDAAKAEAKELSSQLGLSPPHLAIIQVGQDPASTLYVSHKEAVAKEVGFSCTLFPFAEHIQQSALVQKIQALNEDPRIHGILVQLPLPASLDRNIILNTIAPHKDVDGLTAHNLGHLMMGSPQLVPCTALGAMALLKETRPSLRGRTAIIIGCSILLGLPLELLLLQEGVTVFLTHKDTKGLPGLCQQADIVISATGQPHLIKENWVKEGASIIDVGIAKVNGKTIGDVDYTAVSTKAGAITPVPGGVGLTTLAYLLRNLIKAYQRQTSINL